MLNISFSPWPSFTEEEAEAVKRVLLSNRVNYWTGQEGRYFEEEFAAFADSGFAVALSNGTVALEAALIALGIGSGDEVIVTSRTFIASVSSIVITGAKPIFADVDRDSQNITAKTVEQHISPRTKAVMCVHLAGWPCEMDAIMALAEKNGLFVIEDCAQAHGARYKGRSVGSFGHVSAWSFCQDKIITTGGEGGMVTTNDRDLWAKIWSYKDHGKSWEAVSENKDQPGFRWLHRRFGTNWRMTEMQAAIGRIQLRKMDRWHATRSGNAETILETARSLTGLRVAAPPESLEHAWYKCYVFIVPEKIKPGWSRDRIIKSIQEMGVPCYSGSCSEVYLEDAFDGTHLRPEIPLLVAKELGETSLMFLVHPSLKGEDIEKTCHALSTVMAGAVSSER